MYNHTLPITTLLNKMNFLIVQIIFLDFMLTFWYQTVILCRISRYILILTFWYRKGRFCVRTSGTFQLFQCLHFNFSQEYRTVIEQLQSCTRDLCYIPMMLIVKLLLFFGAKIQIADFWKFVPNQIWVIFKYLQCTSLQDRKLISW